MTTTYPPAYVKTIIYDRGWHDYAMYLDDELVGYARTNHDAEVTLDELTSSLRADDERRIARHAEIADHQDDPPEVGPDDGTGLGDRDEEGDDPDN